MAARQSGAWVARRAAAEHDVAMDATLPPPEIVAALRRMGLLRDGGVTGQPLTGGVASDIWKICLPNGPVCVKRALAKLRVTADWRAPVERNRYEARWMQRAAAAAPGSVPELLGQDEESGALAMQYLPPEFFRLWKNELRDGHADPTVARAVADRLVRIHAATAADPAVASEFPTDRIFYDIRLEPYLVATAARHPDRAAVLHALVETTQRNKHALVHGDVSPKNILVGPQGPVFLDAECAWFGDPAFDLAFCLNHLLLKGARRAADRTGYSAAFSALAHAYLAGVDWESADALEGRAAALLPALFLARVDGKSPVEYLTLESERAAVRSVAQPLIADSPRRLSDVALAWGQAR